MNKSVMFVATTFLGASVFCGNALACEKIIRQNDWRDSSNPLRLPMSEVVFFDNGFDPVYKVIFDHNFSDTLPRKGLFTSWSDKGNVKVFRYLQRPDPRTGIPIIVEWQLLEGSEMNVMVGDTVYTAQWDADKERYVLPPEALKALSEAHQQNLAVKIRLVPSGTVNEIGSGTVKAFAELFRQNPF